jgi:hypothetical protein
MSQASGGFEINHPAMPELGAPLFCCWARIRYLKREDLKSNIKICQTGVLNKIRQAVAVGR